MKPFWIWSMLSTPSFTIFNVNTWILFMTFHIPHGWICRRCSYLPIFYFTIWHTKWTVSTAYLVTNKNKFLYNIINIILFKITVSLIDKLQKYNKNSSNHFLFFPSSLFSSYSTEYLTVKFDKVVSCCCNNNKNKIKQIFVIENSS